MSSELLRGFGVSPAGVWLVKHVISPLDRALYPWTGGRGLPLGRPLGPRLLLTTTGRRTGRPRTTPVFYLRDGERLVICNVNPGFERPNPWTVNLRARPLARVQVGHQIGMYRARPATGDEVARYWPRLVAIWPAYQAHFDRSGRRTLFILERAPEGGSGAPLGGNMAESSGEHAQPATVQLAWKVIFLADAAVILYGLLAVLKPAEMLGGGFEKFTGRRWAALHGDDPASADYVAMLGRVLGALNVAVGVLGCAVAAGALRRGEAWAWHALLVGNAFGYGGPIAFDLKVRSITIFEQLEMALAALVGVALAMSARDVLGRHTRGAGPPPAVAAGSRVAVLGAGAEGL
jgi:deazaflavin-dependent oxidoreductase (nitroreductase family)